jgi:DNA-binding XRE family transcriptional regulator
MLDELLSNRRQYRASATTSTPPLGSNGWFTQERIAPSREQPDNSAGPRLALITSHLEPYIGRDDVWQRRAKAVELVELRLLCMDKRRLVGRNVRRIREEKGLTQEQFAEISGFSQQYISGLEQGRRNPTVITLYELAVALGASHVDLIMPPKKRDADRRMQT